MKKEPINSDWLLLYIQPFETIEDIKLEGLILNEAMYLPGIGVQTRTIIFLKNEQSNSLPGSVSNSASVSIGPVLSGCVLIESPKKGEYRIIKKSMLKRKVKEANTKKQN